jgi:hypothetical protein
MLGMVRVLRGFGIPIKKFEIIGEKSFLPFIIT